eukprot:TRINITY_DN5962_c0_g1_i2.p2 TRINITY_DN5962_c0_g1~~TRINITY_DN5962_c0_g1_i2.p2  ORF type:complete len:182 (-),score=44.49 TRINITY_DN5962_c0_g1_i2:194-739(-)
MPTTDDAAAKKLEAWREAKSAEWAQEGSKIRTKHPDRAKFEEWMDRQCAKSLKLKEQSDVAADDARTGFAALKADNLAAAFLHLGRAVNAAPGNKEVAAGFSDVWEDLEAQGMNTWVDCAAYVEGATGEKPERLTAEAEKAVEEAALADFDTSALDSALLNGMDNMTPEQLQQLMDSSDMV